MTTILTKKKDTTGAPAPGDLTNGAGGAELAVNTADKRLYTKNSGGTVVEVGTNPATFQINSAYTFPTSDGTTGQVLATNGSGALSFSSPTTGTVTSVDVSGGTTGLTTSGGPVTSSGTITLAGTLAVANGGTGITAFGTGVGTALGVNTGSAGAFVVNGGALGTPSSGTLTNATGLPIGTGVSGLGTNVATFLGTPSSANLAAAVTDETGSGLLVFATSPTLVTPVLGTPSSGTLSGCTVDGTDAVGFRNTPVNSKSADYTLVLADSGKTIFHPAADNNARTFTIPANSSVAYPVGTVLTFVNLAAADVTIAITTDTMYLAGPGTTGSRTLAEYGIASAVKLASTDWLISGNGLT
jgi:urease beta subunit